MRGFTLIELMIGLVILGILTAIAYPAYMGTVQRANRTDALEALTTAANRLELFYTDNDTYTVNVEALGLNLEDEIAVSENGHYRITVAAGDEGIVDSYVVTAAARHGDVQAGDDGCTELTLDWLGRRTPPPETSNCW
jgi:type IV pilus assembly protein PilE